MVSPQVSTVNLAQTSDTQFQVNKGNRRHPKSITDGGFDFAAPAPYNLHIQR